MPFTPATHVSLLPTDPCSLPPTNAQGGSADEVLLATTAGVLVRMPLASVSVYSRTAKGPRLVKLDEGDQVVTAMVCSAEEELVE